MNNQSSCPANYQATIEGACDYAFERLAVGETLVNVSFGDCVRLDRMNRQAEAKTKWPQSKLFRPHGTHDVNPWHDVYRATYVNGSHHNTLNKKLAGVLLSGLVHVPALYMFGHDMAIEVRRQAREAGMLTMVDWSPNRIGINDMRGSKDKAAIIGSHVDVPTEHGLVIALRVTPESGFGTIGPPVEDNLQFIFGSDTCNLLGLEQTPHDSTVDHRRLSVTYADLRPNPVA